MEFLLGGPTSRTVLVFVVACFVMSSVWGLTDVVLREIRRHTK